MLYFEAKGIDEMIRALRRVEPETRKVLRKESSKLADLIVAVAKAKAGTPQQSSVAGTIRSNKSSTQPTIVVPSRRFPGNPKANVMDVFFGAEFGGRRSPRTMQFPPHIGQKGYFLWPAVREGREKAMKEYREVVERLWRDLLEG